MKKFVTGQYYQSFNSVCAGDKVSSSALDDYPRVLEINGTSAEVETRLWGIVTRKIEVENGVEVIRNIDNIYGDKFDMRADKPLRKLPRHRVSFGWCQGFPY